MDKIVHFEIPVDDVARAKEFYGSVFGWRLQDVEGMDYTMVQTTPVDENQMPTEPGAINGGIFQRAENNPTSTVVTIGVDSVDVALKEVEAHGGSVFRPRTDLPGMGAFAYFTDPDGNIVGVFESS